MPLYNPEDRTLRILNITNFVLLPNTALLDIGNESTRESFIITNSSSAIVFVNFDEDEITFTSFHVRIPANNSYSPPTFLKAKINVRNSSSSVNATIKLVEFG
ncbi:MAG: hypothetical protein HC874_07395 [Richelia sp. SL_2_1]|nr:hypothetical protein [Richelia sp. RM1_1_1]NJO27388.1 hypothetical protein [Richelia sp. SL_2_1]